MEGPLLEGIARVVAIDQGSAILEPEQTSSCGGCLSAANCGHQAQPVRRLAARRFALVNDFGARVGDRVVLGFPTQGLLLASALAYALPLATMIGGALAGMAAIGGDAGSALGAVLGLAAGFLAVRLKAVRLAETGVLSPHYLRRAGLNDSPAGCIEA